MNRTARAFLLIAALISVICLALVSGDPDISAFQALAAILPEGWFGLHVPDGIRSVILDIRLPRIGLGILAGAGLALAGAGTQAVLNNPLVSPSILGVSAGAALGANAAILFGAAATTISGQTLIVISAFSMSLLAVGLAYGLAAIRRASRETVILAGIAVGFVFSGASVLLQYLAQWQDLRAMVFWGVGSLWKADVANLSMIGLIVVVGAVLLILQASRLNALALGEETAASVGVSVGSLRVFTLLISALMCATVVSWTGAIAFVGLVAPHMTRMLIGQDNRWLLPASMMMGAAVLVAADTLARMVLWPQEIPVGVMTALLGGIFFLLLLLNRKKDWWGGS